MAEAVASPVFDELDISEIRGQFPIFDLPMNGKPLVYLDSGASAQKPQCVLDAITSAYSKTYANVHRGAYYLSETSTSLYESARQTVQQFVNAADPSEIVFTKGATEAINLVASSWGRANLGPGDEIVLTGLEHHSNIVPWQIIAEQTGAVIRVVPVEDDGDVPLASFAEVIGAKTKMVAVAHVSNALGTVLPIAEITELAHENGAVILIDGCQGIVHASVDVQALDCDFYAFSGHKLYGPSGIGVLYAKAEHLDAMPPYQGGGDMIERVSFEETTYAQAPAKFEAGTPPIVQAIGLGAAVDFVTSLGMDRIAAHENAVLDYGMERLSRVNSLRLIGTAPDKAAVMSFVMEGAHPHDLSTILDQSGVCVRAGHHCAQPLMDRFGVSATARASLGIYNTEEDIDILCDALERARSLLL